MLHTKRIEVKRRIPHFQQGGTNIAIGSPKPYTTQLPGINISPLTLNNPPIEINTSGITEQISKMRDLAFKREELAFKYKELEYKTDKSYLDLFGDILKGIGSAASSIDALGGVASFGQYRDQLNSYNSKKAAIFEEATRGFMNGDKRGAFNHMIKLTQLETDPEILNLKYKTKVLGGLMGKMVDGSMGYSTPAEADKFFAHLQGGKDAPSFEDVVKSATGALGAAVKAKDVEGSLKMYYDLLDPQEMKTTEILPSFAKKETTNYVQRDPKEVAAALLAAAKSDPVLQSLFHRLGFNPSPGTNGFDPAAVQHFTDLFTREAAARNKKSGSFEITGGEAGYKYNSATGVAEKLPDPNKKEGDGASEADKDRSFRMEYVVSKYGHRAAQDPDILAWIKLGGTAEEKALMEKIAAKYLSETGGSTSGDGAGIVPGTSSGQDKGLPNNLSGIQKKFAYDVDPTKTREIEANGNRYLITVEDDLIKKMKSYDEQTGKKEMSDSEVRKFFKLQDNMYISPTMIGQRTATPGFWNSIARWDTDPHVYNLGPVTGSTSSSSGFDPSKLGEQKPIKVADLDLPRKSDFKGEINSHLGVMSKDILEKHKMRVTDTSDSKHDSLAQSTYGTSFDVAFDPDKVKSSETIMNIDKALADFRDRGLTAVYEVKTQKEKDAILAANKNLKDEDVFVWPKVTNPHFSVTCETCSRLDQIKKGAGTTSTQEPTQLRNPNGVYLTDIFK